MYLWSKDWLLVPEKNTKKLYSCITNIDQNLISGSQITSTILLWVLMRCCTVRIRSREQGETETDLASRLPLPALVLAQQNATVGAVVLRNPEPGHAEWDQGTENTSGWNYHFTVLTCKIDRKVILSHIPMTQRQQQRAQARVLGPDLVLVLTWCWHEWHVRSTWDTSHSSVITGTICDLPGRHWAVWGQQAGWRLRGELCEQAPRLKWEHLQSL